MKTIFQILISAAILFCFASCNKDGVVVGDDPQPPAIELDSETGLYIAKVGREITISPAYANNANASYMWTCNGGVLSQQASLVYTFDRSDSYYITIRVETAAGSDEEEIRVDVSDLAPPCISLAIPDGGLNVLAGKEYRFAPDIQNGENASCKWTLDGEEVGNEPEYTFLAQEPGTYTLILCVRNEDGDASKEITVNVVDNLPIEAVVVGASFFCGEQVRNVTLGRTLYLRPYVAVASDAEVFCQWSLDGVAIAGANELMYAFTPSAVGDYTLTFTLSYANAAAEQKTRNVSATGTGEISLDIAVRCCGADALVMRPYEAGCSLSAGKVYEFVPAPGQFVNETRMGGYSGESTHEEAVAYAEGRLAQEKYISLGGWGGYIVVGFDHSIENRGGYDFSIAGNQFDGSSEPGIVYVMQDTNGNGKPDDEWYELKGSEYGKPETIQYYAVTYYRPGAKMATQWTDNRGGAGCIDYVDAYHSQDHYYPAWIKADSYTLYGPLLKDKTAQDPATGLWYNGSFGWGYADNAGGDMASQGNPDADAVKNYFKISDAVNPDGSPADLTHVDFVKVQTALNVKASWLGEISTEVFGFTDENNNE